MSRNQFIIPVKKTQSKLLDQLIDEQCEMNNQQRKIHEQRLHLINSINSSQDFSIKNQTTNHYYSQTASSKAKNKNMMNSKNNKYSNSGKKKQSSLTLTQPKQFNFHSEKRSKGRIFTSNDACKDTKVACTSSHVTNVNNLKNVNEHSNKKSQKLCATKVAEFSFATQRRFKERLTNREPSISHTESPPKTLLKSTKKRKQSKTNVGTRLKRKPAESNKNFQERAQSSNSIVKPRFTSPSSVNVKMEKISNSGHKNIQKRCKKVNKSESEASASHKGFNMIKSTSKDATAIIKQQSLNFKQVASVSDRNININSTQNIVSQQSSSDNKISSIGTKKTMYKNKNTNQKLCKSHSLTNEQMKSMLHSELKTKKKTDWNRMYIQASRKRSRSLTKNTGNDFMARTNRNKSKLNHSSSFNNFSYADFVENYALDALLTDDASRISDDDLEELSRDASINNSINTSPVHGLNSIDSQTSFSKPLENEETISCELLSNNIESNMDDQIVTDIQQRFHKLDQLFGQINADIANNLALSSSTVNRMSNFN